MNTAINDIEKIVREALFRNIELSNRVAVLESEKVVLESEKVALESKNALLEKELSQLRVRLLQTDKPVKDSHNSSIPPSKENIASQSIRRTRSLRTSSGRSPGGQIGHKGTTLQMKEADKTETHVPEYCTKCGSSLLSAEGSSAEIRQSVDIPLPIYPIITNHVSIKKICTCGHCSRGGFPEHVKSGVSYGPNIHAVVAYLSVVQHVPFKRLTLALKDLYGLELSEGSVSNILNRMRKQSKVGYEAIRQQIERSSVVGADETGENLNGKLHWMWTFQNEISTYIFQHSSRGKAAIDNHFPNGLPESTLVSDRHASYFNMETEGHQICLAHLLRELVYLSELNSEQTWSADMLELLRRSIYIRKTIPFNEIDVEKLKEQLRLLLNQDLSLLQKPFGRLNRSLNKHCEHIFKFLQHPEVPYDNNASERVCRPLKVKQKVSGMFKSDDGADAFCQLYSIVDTAKKRGMDPFMALKAVAEFFPDRKGAE